MFMKYMAIRRCLLAQELCTMMRVEELFAGVLPHNEESESFLSGRLGREAQGF